MRREYRVAIMGATGAVGATMMELLEERNFPVASLKLLASHRSAGTLKEFKSETTVVEELTHDSFDDVDLVLSSAGGSISKEFLPTAVKKNCISIDNTNAEKKEEAAIGKDVK
jgi:aspartate-semialdehyde dehydrogenase